MADKDKKFPSEILSEDKQGDFEVHTMPEKFLSLRPGFKIGKKSSVKSSKPKSLKKNIIVGIIVVVVVGGLMALAAWLFLKSVNQESDLSSSLPTNQPPVESAKPAESDESTEPIKLDELPSDNQELLDFNSWLNFDNPTYKYTLKYPKGWTPTSQTDPSSDLDMLEFVAFSDSDSSEHFNISVFSNPSLRPLLSWLTDDVGLNEEDLESFSLQSNSGYKYENTLINTDVIYILYNQNIYSLSFPVTDDATLNQVYANLLLNFKFDALEETQKEAPQFAPATDTDKDNLTDVEEDIYNTNKNRRDTDGDSYIDGDEVANLYDPASPGSARLYTSPSVSTYVNSTYNYNIIHPASWTIKGSSDSIIFQDIGGEFVQVLITSNNQGFADVKEWYQVNINPDISSLSNIKIDNQAAIRTPDSLQVYFIFGDYIYSLIYNIGLRSDTNFITTFDMMVKSFKLMNAGS